MGQKRIAQSLNLVTLRARAYCLNDSISLKVLKLCVFIIIFL